MMQKAFPFSRGNVFQRTAVAAVALSFTLLPQGCWAAIRTLFDTSDTISSQNLQSGGGCENGCVRRVVDAVARAYGDIKCELRVQNLLDHIQEDVTGGALNVVHSCLDADGNPRYQGEGDCLYEVCVSAEWDDGRISYSVTVEHEATTRPHTVHLEVYLNEYAFDENDDGAPTSTRDLQCSLGGQCSSPSECGSDTTAVEVVMEDDYGDGWIGALPDRFNTWTMNQALSADNFESLVANRTLPNGHYSATTSMCLDHGSYAFGSTSSAAWSSDGKWTVCGVEGGLGGWMEFQVDGDGCSVIDDSSADGPNSSDAETDVGDYCSLPQASPCVGVDTGVQEISGLSVGMYYDKTCLDGGGDVPGCNGGGVSTCRLCFVNRDIWEMDFPDERVPDWDACPCCVANFMDVKCQGQFNDTETTVSQTAIGRAQEDFIEGTTPVLAGLGGLLALCWILACCCCRSTLKQHNKTLTYKHGRDCIRTMPCDGDGKTPPGVSPPQERCIHRDNNGQIPLEADLSTAERGEKSSVSPVFVQNGSPLPIQGLPGASQDRPPSDASWPTDSHIGVSVNGKKHPRWSGSRELRAYLQRTGYGNGDAMTILEGKEPKQEVEERNSRRNIVKAIKRAGSFLNDGGSGEQGGKAVNDPWALHLTDMPGAATAAAAEAHLNLPLGDLPVPPSPTNGSIPMVAPVSITTVRSSVVQMKAPRSTRSRGRSLSRSRSSSRSRSRPSIAPTDEPDDDDHPIVGLEQGQSKQYGKVKDPLLDGDDDSSSGAWVLEAPRAPVMTMVPVSSQRGKRLEGRPPKASPSSTMEDVSVLQRHHSRERSETVNGPARIHPPADGTRQSSGPVQDKRKVQRESDHDSNGNAAADRKTRGRAVATKSQPTLVSSARERSRSRHKDREEFKGYRRREREASETPVRDRDSRELVNADSKGVEKSRVSSIENSPDPRGVLHKESEAERRRRRAREERQHQGEEHRRERSKNRSKERNEERRGDPPEYDPNWTSRRQEKNVELQESTAVLLADKHKGYDGQKNNLIATPTVTDAVKGNGVPEMEDATATRPVGVPKTSSMMKFSNDPRAKLARDSERKARQQKQKIEGVDTG